MLYIPAYFDIIQHRAKVGQCDTALFCDALQDSEINTLCIVVDTEKDQLLRKVKCSQTLHVV